MSTYRAASSGNLGQAAIPPGHPSSKPTTSSQSPGGFRGKSARTTRYSRSLKNPEGLNNAATLPSGSTNTGTVPLRNSLGSLGHRARGARRAGDESPRRVVGPGGAHEQ